jgi:hypothetical protein
MHTQFTRKDRRHPSGPHASANLPKVQLEIQRGKAKNLVRQVTGPVYLVGSARDCDLVLGDPQFPQAFAYIFVNESGVTLRRLGVGPDVTVNGSVIEAIGLEDGDRIRTGPFEFHVRIDQPVRNGGSSAVTPTRERKARASEVRRKLAGPRVEQLLADIHHAMFPPAVGLRVYVGPEESAATPHASRRGTRRRATA